MNKYMYLSALVSVLVGLYIPNDMQFLTTVAVIASMLTYIFVKRDVFFDTKKADSARDTDDQVK